MKLDRVEERARYTNIVKPFFFFLLNLSHAEINIAGMILDPDFFLSASLEM